MSAARPFRSARSLGTAVIVLLALNVAVLGVLAVFRLLEQALVSRARRGELVSLDEALRSDDRIVAAAVTWIVVLILTGIVWVVWQHRSQSNLRAIGRRDLTYTPGWAVGWWLIPIANLWMPFKTVRELWKASGREREWSRSATWPVLGWWWAAWLAQAVVGRIAAAMLNEAESVAAVATGSRFALLTVLLTIAAAVFAIVVVRSIVARQEGLEATGVDADPPPPRPDTANRSGASGP
ncbi:MAG TPA: DUF4328 domain-containing protein [Actinomycetota bacterium]|nr:DUF4328 domain-containing protein [Actinomycetota bacterium]